jgi:hypothetical protein
MAMYPTAYSVRHGLAGPGRALRNWVLEGSSDGKTWMPLREHKVNICRRVEEVGETCMCRRAEEVEEVEEVEETCMPLERTCCIR